MTLSAVERRRHVTLVSLLSVLFIVGILGFSSGRLLKSPEERALSVAPPELHWTTVEVESGVLGENFILRGQVVSSNASTVHLPGQEVEGRVTKLPATNTSISSGQAVMEIAGRPILVLEGSFPMYRDLVGGAVGDDVMALQEALASIGFDPGSIDGRYGADTATAIESLYRAAGYSPPSPPGSPLDFRAAESAVLDAREAIRIAEEEQVNTRRQSAIDLVAAERALQDAEDERDRSLTLAGLQRGSASKAVDDGRTLLDLARAAAANSEDPALVEAVIQAETELELAEGALVVAEIDIERSMNAAEIAIKEAATAIQEARVTVRAADESSFGIGMADRLLEDSLLALEIQQDAMLTPVPLGELRFLQSFPVTVDAVRGKVGEPSVEQAVTLRKPSEIVIIAGVPADLGRRLEIGTSATVEIDGVDQPIAAEIGWIAPTLGSTDVDELYEIQSGLADGEVGVEIVPMSDTRAPIGAPASTKIDLFSTEGEELLVPLAAVRTDANGGTWVAVANGDEKFRRIDARVKANAAGKAAVEGSDLSIGDNVILGELE